MKSQSVQFRRALKLELPPGKSAFLWGPRKTGKSTYLKATFPASRRYDFLQTDVLIRLSKEPYSETDCDARFWRTKTGREVDFILGDGKVALEVKGKRRVDPEDLGPIKAFIEDYKPHRAFLVCNETVARKSGEVNILPWREFVARLWAGEVV